MLSRRTVLAAAALLASTGLASAAEQAFTAAAFAAAQKAGKPIVVHIFAPWCPTCRAQEPILHKLESDPRIAAFRVDFDSQKSIVRSLNATNQSTIIVYKGADEVGRSVGETDPQAIAALVNQAL
jgi:thioredoxin 1